jgi:hypothetical protein
LTQTFIRLPRLNDYLDHWAARLPDRPAMIQHEDGKTVTYARFKTLVDFFALRLLSMGIQPGDRVATPAGAGPRTHGPDVCLFASGCDFGAPGCTPQGYGGGSGHQQNRSPGLFLSWAIRRCVIFARRQGGPGKLSVRVHLVQFTPDPGPGDILDGRRGHHPTHGQKTPAGPEGQRPVYPASAEAYAG